MMILYVHKTYLTVFCYDWISGEKWGALKFYLRTHSYTKPAGRRWMGCCKLNVGIRLVSRFVVNSKKKRLTHSCFSKEQTSSVCLFTRLLSFSSPLSSVRVWEQQALLQAGRQTAFAKLPARWSWLCHKECRHFLLYNIKSSKYWMKNHDKDYIYLSIHRWGGFPPRYRVYRNTLDPVIHHRANQHTHTHINSFLFTWPVFRLRQEIRTSQKGAATNNSFNYQLIWQLIF